jgi:hypothetical protein
MRMQINNLEDLCNNSKFSDVHNSVQFLPSKKVSHKVILKSQLKKNQLKLKS